MFPQRVELTALGVALLCSLMVGGQDGNEKEIAWREELYNRCARRNNLTCQGDTDRVLVIRAAIMNVTCKYCQVTCTQQAYDTGSEVLPLCALRPACTLPAFTCDCRSASTSIQATCIQRSAVYRLCGNETRVSVDHGFLANERYPDKMPYKHCMYTIVAGPEGNVTLTLIESHTEMDMIFAACHVGNCQLLYRKTPVTLRGDVSVHIQPTSPDDVGPTAAQPQNGHGMRFLIQFDVHRAGTPTTSTPGGHQTSESPSGWVPVKGATSSTHRNEMNPTTPEPVVGLQNTTSHQPNTIFSESSTMTVAGQTPVAGLGVNRKRRLPDKVIIAIVVSVTVIIIIIVGLFFYSRRSSATEFRRVIVVLVQAPSKQLSRLSRRLSRASPAHEVATFQPENGRRKGKVFPDFDEREPAPLPDMDRLQLPPGGSRTNSLGDSSAGYARLPVDRPKLSDSSRESSGPDGRPVSIQIHVTDVPDDLDDGDRPPNEPKVVTSLEPMGARIIKALGEGAPGKHDPEPSTSKVKTTKLSPGKTNYDVYLVENDDYKSLDQIRNVER